MFAVPELSLRFQRFSVHQWREVGAWFTVRELVSIFERTNQCHAIHGFCVSLLTVAVDSVDERRLFCSLDASSRVHSDCCC